MRNQGTRTSNGDSRRSIKRSQGFGVPFGSWKRPFPSPALPWCGKFFQQLPSMSRSDIGRTLKRTFGKRLSASLGCLSRVSDSPYHRLRRSEPKLSISSTIRPSRKPPHSTFFLESQSVFVYRTASTLSWNFYSRSTWFKYEYFSSAGGPSWAVEVLSSCMQTWRCVLEFGTTQPYRLYIVRFFSSCKSSVTHISNRLWARTALFSVAVTGFSLSSSVVRKPHVELGNVRKPYCGRHGSPAVSRHGSPAASRQRKPYERCRQRKPYERCRQWKPCVEQAQMFVCMRSMMRIKMIGQEEGDTGMISTATHTIA